MRKLPILFLFVLFCLNAFVTHAQTKTTSRGNQQWIQYYGQAELNETWKLLLDGGFRWKNELEDKSQYFIRAAVGYKLDPNLQLAVGVANLGFYSNNEQISIEFRPYQELTYKSPFKKMSLSHRLRVEERFFNPMTNGRIEPPSSFNWRFRYSLGLSFELLPLSKNHSERLLLLNLGNEIFLNAGESIVHNVFDQNRLTMSPTIQWNPYLSFSFTWNRQIGSTENAGEFKYNSILWLQIKHNFKLNNDEQKP